MTKKDLFDFLDGFSFVEEEEIGMAVADFFMEEMGVFEPSYGEIMEYGQLAEEYQKTRKIIFEC